MTFSWQGDRLVDDTDRRIVGFVREVGVDTFTAELNFRPVVWVGDYWTRAAAQMACVQAAVTAKAMRRVTDRPPGPALGARIAPS